MLNVYGLHIRNHPSLTLEKGNTYETINMGWYFQYHIKRYFSYHHIAYNIYGLKKKHPFGDWKHIYLIANIHFNT